jgi:hypothetical protein
VTSLDAGRNFAAAVAVAGPLPAIKIHEYGEDE